MRVIEWLYRHAVWLNLAALMAVVLWVGGIASISFHLSDRTTPQQVQVLRTCPCEDPGTEQRTANRF